MNFSRRNKYLVLYHLGKPIYWVLIGGVCWVVFSLTVIPKYFEASGAVLVCCALISELLILLRPWRQDNELNKYLRADFVESTVVMKSGTTLQLHAYTDEKHSPFHGNETPSEILTFTTQLKKDLDGNEYKESLHKYEPILLLYQLATTEHTGAHKVTPGTNQNPYIAGVELSGWEVRKTLRMVDLSFAFWITIAAVVGTFIWGYGEWAYCAISRVISI